MSRQRFSALIATLVFVAAACTDSTCPSGFVLRGKLCKRCPEGSLAKDDECIVVDGGGAKVDPIDDGGAEDGGASGLAEDASRDAARSNDASSQASDAEPGMGDASMDSSALDANALSEAGADAASDATLHDAAPTDASAGSDADAAGDSAIPLMGDDVIRALSPFAWLRADSVVLSAGKVLSIKDKVNDAHFLTQPDVNAQVAAPSANAVLNGQSVLSFTGTQWYGSTLPASSWAFLHNGLGAEVFHVFTPTDLAGWHCIAATGKGETRVTTSTTYLAGGTLAKTIRNGSATVVQIVADMPVVNIPLLIHEYFALSASPDFGFFLTDGGVISSDATSAPSLEAADGFRLSGCSDGVYNANMHWAESLFFSRVLARGERDAVQSYLAQRYGTAVATVARQ